MNTPFELALKVAAGVAVGLCIGLERQWAHKEVGVRTFAIAALLGTIAWLITPTLAFVQWSTVLLAIILLNIYSLWEEHAAEITTSLALAATNLLGILVGMGNYFLAFACAIAITALLSWKTELITFISKLTVTEIRSALLFAFITAVVYPLLPPQPLDPWHIVNLRSVWLTVMLVSGLQFFNYILLRQLGKRGIQYSALLGGLVNSAATALLLGEEAMGDVDTEREAPGNMLLADTAMILRNWVLVLLFVLPGGVQPAFATLVVLVPMMLVAAGVAASAMWFAQKSKQSLFHQQTSRSPQQDAVERHEKKPLDVFQRPLHVAQQFSTQTVAEEQRGASEQTDEASKTPESAGQSPGGKQQQFLRSPLSVRSALIFGLLFLLLTILSGLGKLLFGSLGFLIVIVIGALASAASSSVLVGQELARGILASSPAAIAMFLATLVGLFENVAIFWAVTRKSSISFRLLLLTLPIVAVGVLAIFLSNTLGFQKR
jgi:uncharacterized membrane protein (DUF4010 family)